MHDDTAATLLQRMNRLQRIRFSYGLLESILMGGLGIEECYPVDAPADVRVEYVETPMEGLLSVGPWFYVYLSSESWPIVKGNPRTNTPDLLWAMQRREKNPDESH